MNRSRQKQGGFTLIELLVAMTITLIVTGAIYGLMATGQSAFRREPELTDRQQNARLSMAVIERDLLRAGGKFGAYAQIFTDNLDGAGLPGLSAPTDYLEMLTNDSECPDVELQTPPTSGSNINTAYPFPDCYPGDSLVALFYPGMTPSFKWGFGHEIHAQNGKLNFPPGLQPPNSQIQSVADLTNPGPPARVGLIEIVRYQIAVAPDGARSLYRTTSGGLGPNTGGAFVNPPDPDGGWQLLARGIEDLQVRYQRGSSDISLDASWLATPGAPTAGNAETVVRRVEVTLSARSMAPLLQGQTSNANLGPAIRGQLMTRVAPRSILWGLQTAPECTGASPSPGCWK